MSGKSPSHSIDFDGDVIDFVSIDENIKNKYEQVILGKFADRGLQTASQVSVTQPNKVELVKLKRDLTVKHPLRCEEPEKWNNIPVCVAESVNHII